MIKFRFMICYAFATAKYPILQLPLTPNLILSEEMQNSYRRHSRNKLFNRTSWGRIVPAVLPLFPKFKLDE